MATAAPADVLRFWFEELDRKQWFTPDPALDRAVRERFEATWRRAAAGGLADWEAAADTALALVLVLDQFPRNMFRATPAAFASDPLALDVARRAVDRGLDRAVPAERRMFLYLPFEHSEDMADQERAVALFTDLGDAEALDYAVRHRDVVARFGRFPHRNAILGRASTPEEENFLKQPNSSF